MWFARAIAGRLWVSLTEAQKDGKPDTNVLYGSKWTSAKEIVSAVRLSAYIPGVSSPSATLKLDDQFPNLGSAYDGGFTQNLPCPPGTAQPSGEVCVSEGVPAENAPTLLCACSVLGNWRACLSCVVC